MKDSRATPCGFDVDESLVGDIASDCLSTLARTFAGRGPLRETLLSCLSKCRLQISALDRPSVPMFSPQHSTLVQTKQWSR